MALVYYDSWVLFSTRTDKQLGVLYKGSPYSITEHRVPELISVLGSQPAGDVSHKPGVRLPLLSARPAVTLATRGVDPMCFSGSGPTHFFRSWVRIGIGPTHFLRWTVYYCVCIQHDIDKSQIWLIELCIELLLLTRLVSVNTVLRQQNLKFSFRQQTVEFGPTHIFTQIYAPARNP